MVNIAERLKPRELEHQLDHISLSKRTRTTAKCMFHYAPSIMDKEVQLQSAGLRIALVSSGVDAPKVQKDDAALFLKTLLRTINICTKHDTKVRKATLA
jgi:hypothetical protein